MENMVQGNLARKVAAPNVVNRTAPDLNRFRRRNAFTPEPVPVQESVETATPRPRVNRHARRVRLSFSGAALFLLSFAAVMFIVYTYMQLSELSKETAALQKTLATIRKDNARLENQAEQQLDLVALAAAAEELGMVIPEKENIVHLDLSGTDHAVVLEKPGLWDSLMNAFTSLTSKVHEYFT